MNEKRFRPQFNQMDTTEKRVLMENLAGRYAMTFLGLHTFDRWGQSCTTGIFEKMAGSSSLSPAIPSPWAGNGSLWD